MTEDSVWASFLAEVSGGDAVDLYPPLGLRIVVDVAGSHVSGDVSNSSEFGIEYQVHKFSNADLNWECGLVGVSDHTEFTFFLHF